MKKLFAVILSLALLMSIVPLGAITASAASLTVYVGGKTLTDGTYLSVATGTTQTVKPANGGFAHLSGSNLILYNYSYTGSGMSIGGGADCTSAVYANGALTVSLYGDNTLNMDNTADSYAIYTTGSLTINEDAAGGNLTINNCTRGIECNGSVTFAGGTTTIAAKDYGIYCNNTFGITKGKLTITAKEQHGIYTKDALIVGGNIAINAQGIGINASGTYGQIGGVVTIDAVSTGILSISTFKQTGGELYITSDSNAVSSISDVTFSGGFFDIKSTTIRALVGKTVTFTNMAPKASTTKDGSLTDYVAANIGNYKRVAYLADVYVGDVGLVNGQYLATGSASATTTKPSGGYAYYKDGTLTLNNYTYDGAGSSVPESPDYTALVYSEKALTVKLVGTNTLTNSIDSYGVGIWVHNEALTIIDGGSGALNMTVKDDGIYAYDDDINIQGGAITITADDYGIYAYGNVDISGGTINVDAGDDGICAGDGDVTISGGTVAVTAEGDGIYSDYNTTISGGTVNVDAVDEGITAYGNLTISDGTVIVNAEEYGIMAYDTLTISDGNVTVVATDNLGICASSNLTISGGKIIVNAYDEGLYANGDTVISGGNVTVYAGYGIYAYDNVDISGGTVTVDADTMGIYTCYGKLTISGGTVTVYGCNDAAVAEEKNIVVSGGTVHLYDCNYGLFTKIGSVVIEGGKITIEAECDAINSRDNALISGGELDLISTDLMSDENYSAIRCHAILLVENITLYAATDPDNAVGTFSLTKLNDYDRIISSCAKHTYSNACDKSCNVCGYTRTPSAHKGGTATCKVKAKCSVCGESYGSLKAHSYEKKTTKATLTKDGIIKNVCKACGYTASKTTTIYKASSVKLSKTSYTYNGKVQKPSVVVKDSKGNTISSSHYTVTYPSGMKNAGTYKVTVKFKGNYSGTKTLSYTIKAVDVSKCKFSLSATSYTYNGKVKKPTVTVKNASGTKLTTSSYTVTYATGRKNVGKYKVTVKMKGNYTGTKTLTFKINPSKTTISKLTAGKKSIKVAITKKSTQVTGYQIQYSTSKKFTKAKTKTISSYKTTKYTLKSLSAKKTYYVRVRTYKKVGKTKYYSGWSTYKYKKTK